jgi:hypothetical protein
MTETLTIGGRQFKLVKDTNLRHDILTQCIFHDLHRHSSSVQMLEGETPEEFAVRILRKVAQDGEIFLLLGHVLMPAEREGKEWTPQMAEETAEFLGSVVDDGDKLIVHQHIAAVFIGLFTNGLSSVMIRRPEFFNEAASKQQSHGDDDA